MLDIQMLSCWRFLLFHRVTYIVTPMHAQLFMGGQKSADELEGSLWARGALGDDQLMYVALKAALLGNSVYILHPSAFAC